MFTLQHVRLDDDNLQVKIGPYLLQSSDLGIPFAVVGALVPEPVLEVRPPYITNDADVTVAVESLADFETLKDRLANFGFERTLEPQRMLHQSGGRVDILPFSHAIAPEGRLELVQGVVLNMAGFEHVVTSAVEATVDDAQTLPVVPLPLYALLKLVAFNDRKAPKDLAGIPLSSPLPGRGRTPLRS